MFKLLNEQQERYKELAKDWPGKKFNSQVLHALAIQKVLKDYGLWEKKPGAIAEVAKEYGGWYDNDPDIRHLSPEEINHIHKLSQIKIFPLCCRAKCIGFLMSSKGTLRTFGLDGPDRSFLRWFAMRWRCERPSRKTVSGRYNSPNSNCRSRQRIRRLGRPALLLKEPSSTPCARRNRHVLTTAG